MGKKSKAKVGGKEKAKAKKGGGKKAKSKGGKKAKNAKAKKNAIRDLSSSDFSTIMTAGYFFLSDRNDDGLISLEELSDYIAKLGGDGKKAKRILKDFDANGNGVLDFDEFVNFTCQNGVLGERSGDTPPLTAEKAELFKEAYRAFDDNEDGHLDLKEFRLAAKLFLEERTARKVDSSMVNQMMKDIRQSGEVNVNNITFPEFLVLVAGFTLGVDIARSLDDERQQHEAMFEASVDSTATSTAASTGSGSSSSGSSGGSSSASSSASS